MHPIPMRSLFLALLFCVLPSACATSPPEAVRAAHAVAGAPFSNDADDELVESRLGPHRFTFARSYLRLGMAPLNDTTIELVMTMPALAPLIREPLSGSLEGAQRVDVWIRALDEAAMARVFSDWMGLEYSKAKPAPLSDDKPRIKGDAVSGLMPFYLDFMALRRQAEARGLKPDTVASPHRVYNRDWYLAYDANDTMVSFIECTPRTLDDGLEQIDGHLRRRNDGNTDVLAGCNHKFVISELNASVNVSYARVFLPEWRRIEDSVKRIIKQSRIR